MDRLTRRRALQRVGFGSIAIVSASLLAACGGSSPVATSSTGSQTAPASAPTATQNQLPASKPETATQLPASQAVTAAGATPSEAGVPGPEIVVKAPTEKEPVTLRFHMRSGGEKSEKAIYVNRPGEWTQATGIQVKLEPIPGDENYVPKLETLAASGTIGDLTWSSDGHNEYRHLAQFKVLEPLDPYLAANHISKDEWLKPVVDTLSTDGKFYSMPKAGYPGYSFIWVNLDMFKAAGIAEPPTHGSTFDDLRDWANKLSKGPKDNREVYGIHLELSGNQPITAGVRQFGGDIVASDGVTSLVDQQGFSDWLTWTSQLVVGDKVHPLLAADQNNGNAIAAMFAAGKVAMVQNDRSFQFLAVNAVKDKFKFTSISYPKGPKSLGWAAVCSGHCGTAASKYKDETFSLLYAIGDKRFAYLVGRDNGYLTGRVDNLEDLGPYAKDHFIQLEDANAKEESAFWVPKNLRAFEVDKAMSNMLDLVWLGKRQPDKSFINDLKKAVDDVLTKPA